jgi:hypothetical protein
MDAPYPRRAHAYEAMASFWRPPGRLEPAACDRCVAPVGDGGRGAWVCQPTEVGQRSMDSTPRWLCEACHGEFMAWMGCDDGR